MTSGPYQHNTVSVMERCGGEVKVPVSRLRHRAGQLRYSILKPGQQQSTAAQPGEDEMLLMFFVHQNREKNEFTRLKDLYKMPRAG